MVEEGIYWRTCTKIINNKKQHPIVVLDMYLNNNASFSLLTL